MSTLLESFLTGVFIVTLLIKQRGFKTSFTAGVGGGVGAEMKEDIPGSAETALMTCF